MLVEKAQPFPIECVVRGYLVGSGWKEYRASGTVCGIKLPAGLVEASRLDEPIFTPSTKAQIGHDENITWEDTVARIGDDSARKLRDMSLELYGKGREFAEGKGIIIADTKFEWGLRDNQDYLDRRSSHSRLVAILAATRLRARQAPTFLRQAVRPRLPGVTPLE